jgi:hypothetical protein
MTTAKSTSIQECYRIAAGFVPSCCKIYAILLQDLMKGVFAGVGWRCPNMVSWT